MFKCNIRYEDIWADTKLLDFNKNEHMNVNSRFFGHGMNKVNQIFRTFVQFASEFYLIIF